MADKTDVSIANALMGVTESSLNNDRALLGLCEVIADTVSLLEKRLSILELSVGETKAQILKLSHFLQDKLRDEFETEIH